MIRLKSVLNKIILLMISLSLSGVGYAGTIPATSCSKTHVQAAIGSASDGDTVVVPAGSCTWSSGVSIPDGVRIQGAGIGNTIISSGSFITTTLGDNSRLSGFEFKNGIAMSSCGENWVIDDSKFVSPSGLADISLGGSSCSTPPTGVYHGCITEGIKFRIRGTFDVEDWSDDLPLGSWRKVIYFEKCTMSVTGYQTISLDSNYGGRKVLRFNIFNNFTPGSHGGRAKVARGTRRYEAYRNVSNLNNHPDANPAPYAFWLRGGDGLWFDNRCDGNSECSFILDFERAYDDKKVICSSATGYETVPHPKGGSPNYLCRDGIGAGRDRGVNPKPPNYEYGQESSPFYIWGNTSYGSTADVRLVNGADDWVIEDRDFFIDASSHPSYGNGGVSRGKWADRPLCKAGKKYHGYWATDKGGNWNSTDEWGGDDGALYVCDGSGNWNLYYTPAPYPHPLIAGAPLPAQAPPPSAPTGLRITIGETH